MTLQMYQVDAFAREPFAGNPAAVVPLDGWLPDALMQSIAGENNLSETAFFVPAGDGYHIRWFTPAAEVSLCGHATLASAHVLFHHLDRAGERVTFESKGGPLAVARVGEWLELDFPSLPPSPCSAPAEVVAGLGREPVETLSGPNYMAVLESEEAVAALVPDFGPLARLGEPGLIVTAAGRECDFVSRYFAPAWGIDEDPATGSTHCELTPFWSSRLGRTRLRARQLSRRGAEIECELRGDRVAIRGGAVTYMIGTIRIP